MRIAKFSTYFLCDFHARRPVLFRFNFAYLRCCRWLFSFFFFVCLFHSSWANPGEDKPGTPAGGGWQMEKLFVPPTRTAFDRYDKGLPVSCWQKFLLFCSLAVLSNCKKVHLLVSFRLRTSVWVVCVRLSLSLPLPSIYLSIQLFRSPIFVYFPIFMRLSIWFRCFE